MNLFDEPVIHINFGIGRVLNVDNGRIAVAFTNQSEQKKFLYPEAFDEFLKMRNPVIQEKVFAELMNKREHEANEKRLERERLEEAAKLASERKEETRIASLKRKRKR
ncbi:hypothetical protein [Paenibacillus pseudetheri]|uniref:Uncharacterized protein n=1 Tax=Paenibacillus pseudetheri TaxID=2897682 RepID=A0ABN8FU96_9BACL|nr:hypothetical protein [Paenibacillus pseudetheri]CAH1059231.1 hypothetical protein PAECIP111894_05437 [Paenibacillus pseudetheri]